MRKILHSDKVLTLKIRLLLKTLWLISFVFFSMLLSVQLSELAAVVLSFLNSTRSSSVIQRVTTAGRERYSSKRIIQSGVKLLFSSLWDLFTELEVN
jgi:hypothetical protein